MNYEIEQKLKEISKIWDYFIVPSQFCRNQINYGEQELTNYFVGITGYFHDTFEIIIEPQQYNNFTETFSYYISYLQAIYIQQDFVAELLNIFGLMNAKKNLNKNSTYSQNRKIRNELIGHPISRNKQQDNRLESSTTFGYWPEKDSITYLRYHRNNNFNGEIISYNISEIRMRHIEFLNLYFDKILEKLKKIVNKYLLVINKVILNLKVVDFQTVIEDVSTYLEFILSHEFEKERILEIYRKKGEHIRYENMIDYFLNRVNYCLLEMRNVATSFIENKEFIAVNQNELIFKYNDSINNEFHYELGKLSESNLSIRNFDFNSGIIRRKFSENLEINEELNNMTQNPTNIMEYYCSIKLLNQLINNKTNNCP